MDPENPSSDDDVSEEKDEEAFSPPSPLVVGDVQQQTKKPRKNQARRSKKRFRNKKCPTKKDMFCRKTSYGSNQNSRVLSTNTKIRLPSNPESNETEPTTLSPVHAQLCRKEIRPKHLSALADCLTRNEDWWEFVSDRNRSVSASQRKAYVRCGKWNEQGKFDPNRHKAHWAGKVGKDPNMREVIKPLLKPLWETASKLLQKHFSPIANLVEGCEDFEFGSFHLFMCARGISAYHRDPNDYIAFLFPIQVEEGKGGALEFGGTDLAFQLKIGDCVFFSSRLLEHGTKDYQGDPENRLVGIFLIQHFFLKLKGFTNEQIYSDGKRINIH